MRIASAGSTKTKEAEALDEVYERVVAELDGEPTLWCLHATETYDVEQLNARMAERADGVPIHGGTSCLGVMTEEGIFEEEGRGVGLLGLSDPDGSYGVGASTIDDDPKAAAARAVKEALEAADRVGEMPQLIWVIAEPGHEEELIAGIENVLGSNVPILGGSAADNAVAGNWHQFANGKVYSNAVVVTAMYPSTDIGFSFHSGYEPTEKTGEVTRAEGRTLYEIDGRPAANVYNEWTGGTIEEALGQEISVLDKTTLHPLGRRVGAVEGTSYFQLSHPERVTEEGALTLFTDIEEGDELICMAGTIDSLTSRAGRVAEAALETTFRDSREVAGALVIYCAGCMLTVRERIEEVTEGLNDALGHQPFLGTFTFGEQGCFIGGENRHGNLMISVVTFYS